MFTKRWQLFRLWGIPVGVDASWLLILALLSWTLAGVFQEAAPQLEEFTSWILGFFTALAFFVCIVLHEFGHALVARRLGIPLRGITLFLFGGVAEMESEPSTARDEFLMAIAGPLVSAALAAVFAGLAVYGLPAGWDPQLVLGLQFLCWINLSVLIFNLVPAFPLDGGRVLRSLLWGAFGNLRRATYWAAVLGQVFGGLLIVGGIVQFAAGYLLGGMWMAIIGFFLHSAARVSYQQMLARQLLQGEPIRRFMNLDPVVVPPTVDLRRWVEDYVYRYHLHTFPVTANGGPVEGVIATSALGRYPAAEWGLHTVQEAMRRDVENITLGPDVDALAALERMQRTREPSLLVTENNRLVGVVNLQDILAFLQLKMELDNPKDEPPGPGRPEEPGISSREYHEATHV